MAGNLWWCSLLSLLFMVNQGPPVWSQGFAELSAYFEVVNNAMHLYGPPVPSANIPPVISNASQVRLFPCMNFTCSGRIRKLMFVAPVLVDRRPPVRVRWPTFGVWSKRDDSECQDCYWAERQIVSFTQPKLVYNASNVVGIYELDLEPTSSSLSFANGDILGMHHHVYPINDNLPNVDLMSIFYQNGGGYCDSISSPVVDVWSDTVYIHTSRVSKQEAIVPYIAIETELQFDESSTSCAMGFLNRESLELIVDAPRDDTIFRSLNFTQNNNIIQNMLLRGSGSMIKFVIAAKFNHTERSGWPLLQISRRDDDDGFSVTTMTLLEPRPTGYLNVFEYDPLSADIQSEDVVHICIPESSGQRYLLAYLTDLTTSKPMVYANVSNENTVANPPSTATASNQPICVNDATQPSISTTAYQAANTSTTNSPRSDLDSYTAPTIRSLSTHSESSDTSTTTLSISSTKMSKDTVTAIVGGVLGTLVVLMLLAFMIIIVFFIYKHVRNEKQFSPNTSRTANNRIRVDALDNATYAPDSILPTSEQRMSSDCRSEGGGTGATGSGAGAASSSQNNPQEDYYYYKLYEWGVFVPTVNQREAVTEALANTSDVDTLYSTLGESQYSTLSQLNQTPEFFDESEDYWVPASDEKSLYEQLSRKKYREIHKNQIQVHEQLGSGQFGNVMKGVWLRSGGSKEVAVKLLKEGSSEEDKVKFMQEAAINGQFWHPNIVRLMGVVTVGEPTMIVLEFLTNGDLRSYLMKMQPTPGEMAPSNTPHTLLRFCKEISSGMKYLAQKKFVHRDLAARNVLLSEEKTCKISDFGMSRNLDNDSYYVSRGGMIPVKWTAPEALHYKKYSTLSDVWSFGAVLYEIWSLGHKPFEEYTNREVIRKVDSGFRLPPPPGCPRDVYHLMIQCWHPQKNVRPSFSDLHVSLSDHSLSLRMRENEEVNDQLHPQAYMLGVPLEAGNGLFKDLQNTYLNEQ